MADATESALTALTDALDNDDKPRVAEKPQKAQVSAVNAPAPAESEPEEEEPEQTEAEPETEAEAEGEPDELTDDSVVELPLKDREGNPIQATLRDLREWRENGLRQADYSRNLNQVAQQRQELERVTNETRARVEQDSQKYIEQLQMLQATVLSTVAPELQGVNWQNLAIENPQRYLVLKAKYDQTQQALSHIENLHRQHQEQRGAQMQATQREAAKKAVQELQETIPNWNNETYGALMNYAVQNGYSEEEVLNATDAKAFKLLWKAAQYDQLQKVKPNVQSKLQGLPKVVKPGNQNGKVSGKTTKLNQVVQQHSKDRSVRSLANLLNAIE
jgi:hypothetical protein